MRLLCDHMLGSLAKWLRIFGFDTLYPDASADDDQVLQQAQQENRFLISRDKELLQRGKKAHIDVLLIQTTNLSEQLTQVLAILPVDLSKVLSRCILCNTPLIPVKKEEIKENIPPKVYETRNEFWCCPSCKKYYWMGTHYENMKEKIRTLTMKNQEEPS
jgi:uncharacterized protein with PIN domain